jgi:hypothetical protein
MRSIQAPPRSIENPLEVVPSNLQPRLRLGADNVGTVVGGHVDARIHFEQGRELRAKRELVLVDLIGALSAS